MPKLPVVSSKQVIGAFERRGWVIARQKGGHIIMTKTGASVVLTIPHKKEMPRGTPRQLIRISGLTVRGFIDALKG